MIKLYSWKDVDRLFLQHKNKWREVFNNIEIYANEVVFSRKDGVNDNEIKEVFLSICNKKYCVEDNCIKLDLNNYQLNIIEENDVYISKEYRIPLFKNAVYKDKYNIIEDVSYDYEKDVPIIAFHSYKGGVGRTLSLMAYLRAFSTKFPNDSLLVIDSDIEAPGLTWLMDNEIAEDSFSYLDLLEIMQWQDDYKEVTSLVKSFIKKNVIRVDNGNKITNHFFLPVNRYKEQLLDLYSTLDVIVKKRTKKFFVRQVLNSIGKELGVKAVLVDLRAGYSEYSAPIIFDNNIKKYIISSTSFQSIKGTIDLLECIKNFGVLNSCSLLLNMIPRDILNDNSVSQIKNNIISSLNNTCENDEDFIIETDFSNVFIHLDKFSDIMKKMIGQNLYDTMINEVIQQFYRCESTNEITGEYRTRVLKDLYKFCFDAINAEQEGNPINLMRTTAINNLINDFSDSLPAINILGTKGAGKTFLYRKIIKEKKWKQFCNTDDSFDSFILPLVNPASPSKSFEKEISDCVSEYYRNSMINSDQYVLPIDNINEINKFIDNNITAISEWDEFWRKLISNTIYNGCKDINEADKYLHTKNKNVIIIIDGLEEMFLFESKKQIDVVAIRSLCQNVKNYISQRCNHIGIITFIRKDIAAEAIVNNYEQFYNASQKYSLSWSYDESIRFAYWLYNKATNNINEDEIYNKSINVIIASLVNLWGTKLGPDESKEAYTIRWILAALSDFNGQLSARDMVRFLQESSKISLDDQRKDNYDRIIYPLAIKKAVKNCAKAKLIEIKTEYKNLSNCFDKLEKLDKSIVSVPLSLDELPLDNTQIVAMITAGFLRSDNEKYYLPECIRDGLGIKTTGARYKVLSLMNIPKEYAMNKISLAEIAGKFDVVKNTNEAK